MILILELMFASSLAGRVSWKSVCRQDICLTVYIVGEKNTLGQNCNKLLNRKWCCSQFINRSHGLGLNQECITREIETPLGLLTIQQSVNDNILEAQLNDVLDVMSDDNNEDDFCVRLSTKRSMESLFNYLCFVVPLAIAVVIILGFGIRYLRRQKQRTILYSVHNSAAMSRRGSKRRKSSTAEGLMQYGNKSASICILASVAGRENHVATEKIMPPTT